MDGCQLEQLPQAGEKLGGAENGLIRVARRLTRLTGGRLQLPVVAIDLLARTAAPPRKVVPPPRRAALNLQPGERVRVRTREEIRTTLDAHDRCAGLSYMPVMERFQGQTFAVRKRIDRFFDERTRTMLRVRDVVILEGVFCEAGLTSDVDYGGCQRTCFLFWKEDWLERLDARPTSGPAAGG
jgi:hypothetical protein